jgi:hypothetical protein
MSSSSSLEVRSATLRDAKAITEVHLEATRAAYRDLLTAEQILPVLALAAQAPPSGALQTPGGATITDEDGNPILIGG